MAGYTINIDELKKMLKGIVWDYNTSEDELLEIFLNKRAPHEQSGY
jgi:hypothetical protein